MKRRLWPVLLATLTLLSSAEARLGDTMDECTLRYGDSRGHRGHSPIELVFYEKDGVSIVVELANGLKVKTISYWHKPTKAQKQSGLCVKLSDDEVREFLAENAAGSSWVKRGVGVWEREDGQAEAHYPSPDFGENTHALRIRSTKVPTGETFYVAFSPKEVFGPYVYREGGRLGSGAQAPQMVDCHGEWFSLLWPESGRRGGPYHYQGANRVTQLWYVGGVFYLKNQLGESVGPFSPLPNTQIELGGAATAPRPTVRLISFNGSHLTFAGKLIDGQVELPYRTGEVLKIGNEEYRLRLLPQERAQQLTRVALPFESDRMYEIPLSLAPIELLAAPDTTQKSYGDFMLALQGNRTRDAIAIGQKLLDSLSSRGKDSQELVAEVSFRLAKLYIAVGAYAEADRLIAAIVPATKKDTASQFLAIGLLDILARLRALQGNHESAMNTLTMADEIELLQFSHAMRSLSEKARVKLLGLSANRSDLVMTVCLDHHGPDGPAVIDAFLHVVRRKGFVTRSMATDYGTAHSHEREAVVAILRQLTDTQTELGALVLNATALSPKTSPDSCLDSVVHLAEMRDRLQRQLSLSLGGSVSAQRCLAENVDVELVRRQLGSDEVLIEFASYYERDLDHWNDRDLNALSGLGASLFRREHRITSHSEGDNSTSDTQRYVAFVLRREWKEPRLVRLGNVRDIDALIMRYRHAMQRNPDNERDLREMLQSSVALELAVWEPLRRVKGKVRTVYLSPTGKLGLVSFAGLMTRQERYLVEYHNFAYVTSGAHITRSTAVDTSRPTRALLVGDPSFGKPREPQANHATCLTDLQFDALPGTRREVEVVASLLKARGVHVSTLLGGDASESQLLGTSDVDVLHVATHGFFLELNDSWLFKEYMPGSRGLKAIGLQDAIAEGPAGQVVDLLAAEYAPYMSGIALAGANAASVRRREGAESDGILTAAEAATLDLHATHVVVLSACQTGAGAPVRYEGILGMRRALALAGARESVLALWQVEDEETALLMEAFYRLVLQGQPIASALGGAQRWTLARYRRLGKPTSPTRWAAFTASTEKALPHDTSWPGQ